MFTCPFFFWRTSAPTPFEYPDLSSSTARLARCSSHRQGFSGRLQLATPDIYACSELEKTENEPVGRHLGAANRGHASGGHHVSGGHHAGGSPGYGGGPSHNGGGGEGGGEWDLIHARDSVHERKMARATGTKGHEAVLVSRSLPEDPLRCTFEAKVGDHLGRWSISEALENDLTHTVQIKCARSASRHRNEGHAMSLDHNHGGEQVPLPLVSSAPLLEAMSRPDPL